MINEISKVIDLNTKKEERVLDFSDFHKQEIKFDIDKLQEAYNQIVKIKKFEDAGVTHFGAISLTQIPGDPESIKGNKARGIFWTKPDKSGKEVVRDQAIDESAYSEFISDYENTYFKEVYDVLSSKYKLGRMRILLKEPRSTLSWHRDPEPRLHIPIITNKGCRMVIEEVSKHMPFGYRFLFANRWLFGGMIDSQMSSTPVINAMIRTTTAPTMLSGSIKSNVLPIEASALINFRLHPRDSIKSVTEHVRRIVGSDEVEVRSLGGMEASGISSWNSPGFNIVASSLDKIYGDVVSVPGLMIAASDTRHYSKIADNSFRFNPFSIVPEDMTGFHGTNESIDVDSFVAGVKTYVEIIAEGSSN